MVLKTHYADWRELPYRRIFVEDTEYYPGAGRDHGGREGDLPTPLCSTVIELRSGQVQQWWQGEPNPLLPRLGPDDLYVSYFLPAEFSQRRAHGFGGPPNAIDAYTEFRHLTNDARIKSGDRPKGFYSLAGALRHLHEDELSVAHKEDARNRIIRGPPFDRGERVATQHYNLDDMLGAARAFKKLVPTIPSLPHALNRGEFEWALSAQERRGVPTDLAGGERIDAHWNAIKVSLVVGVDRQFDCYDIADGEPHFRTEKFQAYLRRQRIQWPLLDSGEPDLKGRTFRDMARSYPQLAALHELRNVLAQLRSNKLAIGRDGRNRCLLGPYGTKTGRNAPSNSKYIFGPSKCLRFLIMPSAGSALIHRDFAQQEVRIAAIKSGDMELLAVCEAGDVYNGIAEQLGYAENRPLFKTVVLGILYGLEARSLAWRVGISIAEAAEILARLRARFRTFEYFCAAVSDHAGLDLVVSTNYGWTMHCPPGTSKRTLRNWPVQAAGAEVMHLVCILAERRGLPLVAPIHDAFMAEAAVADIEDVSRELDRVMGDASGLVLKGYRLPTDPAGAAFLRQERRGDVDPHQSADRRLAKADRMIARKRGEGGGSATLSGVIYKSSKKKDSKKEDSKEEGKKHHYSVRGYGSAFFGDAGERAHARLPLAILGQLIHARVGCQTMVVAMLLHRQADLRHWPVVKLPIALFNQYGFDRRTVSRALQQLERKDLVRVHRHSGKRSTVTVLWHPIGEFCVTSADGPEVTKRPDFTHKRTNHELRRPCERYRAQP